MNYLFENSTQTPCARITHIQTHLWCASIIRMYVQRTRASRTAGVSAVYVGLLSVRSMHERERETKNSAWVELSLWMRHGPCWKVFNCASVETPSFIFLICWADADWDYKAYRHVVVIGRFSSELKHLLMMNWSLKFHFILFVSM